LNLPHLRDDLICTPVVLHLVCEDLQVTTPYFNQRLPIHLHIEESLLLPSFC
jgi:hypothetical protein